MESGTRVTIIIGSHVRHTSGLVGTVFGIWLREGVRMLTVCLDSSRGCHFAAYAESEWEVA